MPGDVIIGIDLGTTNSCVAVVEGGKAVVIPNRGHLTTPSVVAIDANGNALVGHPAKRQAITNPFDTAQAIKRLIGRRWNSEQALANLASTTCPLVEGPNGDVRVQLRNKAYALAELNAMILRDLKAAAETYLQRPVNRAVITVPAYFNDGQRQSTQDAATIAGLELVRTINEPTAAAIGFGFGKETDTTLLVYDLGAGTFDISIVRIGHEGTFEVLGTGGDTLLGGEDVDNAVCDWLVKLFWKQEGIDLQTDLVAMQRLKDAAETAKCALSGAEATSIELMNIAARGPQKLHLCCTLPRAELDKMCRPLVDRTIALTREALAESKVGISQIDDLLLVGGSSRIPMVHQSVTQMLGRKPSQRVHPDEAVAVGAAIHGHSLTGEQKRIRLLDVTPYTLGLRLRGNRREALIPKNTRIPVKRTRNVRTTRDDQTHVDIVVLQGESEQADQNVLLGQFTLANLRAAPAGTVSIDVTFAVDESGVVQVTANDVETGRAQSVRVAPSGGLTAQEVTAMAEAARRPQAAAAPAPSRAAAAGKDDFAYPALPPLMASPPPTAPAGPPPSSHLPASHAPVVRRFVKVKK